MTVVFDISYLQQTGAGITRYCRELLRGLLAKDVKNDYVLHGWSLSLDRDEIASLARDNVRLSARRIPGPLKRMYWNRIRFPALGALVGAFDIFHSAEPLLPPLGKGVGVITVHDLAYLRYPRLFQKSVLRRDPFVRGSISRAGAIIVPSLATKSDLVELLGVDERRIHLIRPPVFAGCSPLRERGTDEAVLRKYRLRPPFALFVGVIEPRKNIEAIIRAFEKAQGDFDLVLVGKPGWLYQGTLLAINRSPARSRIHLLGFVPDRDLPSIYRNARFFVFPSLFEGYGSPVAEAMASGLPVITSRNSSLREIAADAAHLVDPGNDEELTAAMQLLAGDDAACRRLAALGLEQIRKLQEVNAPDAVLRLYDDLEKR